MLTIHGMAPEGASGGVASNGTREGTRAVGSRADEAVSESTAGAEDRSSETSAVRAIGPQHARFRTLVLEPRRIRIYDQKPKARPPELHFATQLPTNGGYAADPRYSTPRSGCH